MITILFDTIKTKDVFEKERIEKLIKEYKIEGSLVDFVDSDLEKRIAEQLKVDVSIINLDIHEIDVM